MAKNGRYKFKVTETYYNCKSDGSDLIVSYDVCILAKHVSFIGPNDNGLYNLKIDESAFQFLNEKHADELIVYPSFS